MPTLSVADHCRRYVPSGTEPPFTRPLKVTGCTVAVLKPIGGVAVVGGTNVLVPCVTENDSLATGAAWKKLFAAATVALSGQTNPVGHAGFTKKLRFSGAFCALNQRAAEDDGLFTPG
jgi:hypothetical protein